MLFRKRFWAGIRDGSITVTFRRWKAPRVIAGRRYRTAGGMIEVTEVAPAEVANLTDADAIAAGYTGRAELLGDLPRETDGTLYRIAFHTVQEEDPRDVLAAEAVLTGDAIAEIEQRLARLDRASKHGPWTADTLRAIAAAPGRRAVDLATAFGRERDPLKLDIRKLKALGLTLSLDTGYRLSPRGEAYLHTLDSASTPAVDADVKDSDSV